jgi:hypothetical protein
MTKPAVWSFASAETGVFQRGSITIPAGCDPAPYAPAGHMPIEGRHDWMRTRRDVSTGGIVPYQPPAPPDDTWQTWSWDAAAWRWISAPTDAAIARDARAERDRRLLACDWTDTASAPARLGSVVYAAWQQYRQDLRDISLQPGFPAAINWPQAPTS